MIGALYFIVIVLANTVGSISGMGGGVLIKPIFDLINVHSVSSISFYSSIAVLTMSIVSTLKQIRNGICINWYFALQISVGAIIGGLLGNHIFEYFLFLFSNDNIVQLIQIILTVLTLIWSFLYSKNVLRNYHVQSSVVKVLVGISLGLLASFLGIGGGPINVSLLMFLFNVPIKQATVYSIITIFFSQLAKVLTIVLTTNVHNYDVSMLYYIIPAAIIGGFLGSYISSKVADKQVNQIYQIVIISVLIINIFNGWRLLH